MGNAAVHLELEAIEVVVAQVASVTGFAEDEKIFQALREISSEHVFDIVES